MRFFLSIFLISVFLSCDGSRKSKEILSKEKMVSVLIDIQMAEAFISRERIEGDSALALYQALEEDIFETHAIDSSSFKKSFRYYSENIAELDEIYEWVLDSLNQKQVELQ